jgi:hypothetical protein
LSVYRKSKNMSLEKQMKQGTKSINYVTPTQNL